jgi:flagellar motor switch protein FliM
MEKVLSQAEINALLHGVEGGEVNTTPTPMSHPGVAPYDFANPDRIIRGRGGMPVLEVINDSFCRLFRTSLSSALRKTVDVNLKGVQTLKFGEFMKTLPLPSSLHIFKMDPLRGHAILVFESKLVFTLVDVFLGGSGKTNFQIEGREFTAIESRLIQKVVTMVFNSLDKAWHPVHPLTFQYIRSEMNPKFVSIVPASDLVLTISFGVELEGFSGTLTLCIPYTIMEPIKTKLYSAFQVDQLEIDPSWIERLLDRLKSAKVELKVELGRHHLMVQDLLQLKAGDVLLLEKEVSEPLVVQVQGIPKFLGRAGVCGGNKAIQIEEKIKTL